MMTPETDEMPMMASESKEATSVFLPKSAFGNAPVEKGQTISLTIKDVDPETGDVEATVGEQAEEAPAYEQDFDTAMPEEEEV
jgi:hypothetical protein